jgi:hypothetical protein
MLLVGTVGAYSDAQCDGAVSVSATTLHFPPTLVSTYSEGMMFTISVNPAQSYPGWTIWYSGPSTFQYAYYNSGNTLYWTDFTEYSGMSCTGNYSWKFLIRYKPTDSLGGARGQLTLSVKPLLDYNGHYGDVIGTATVDLESSPLPVELSTFTIKGEKKNAVELDWTTISEKNNYGFYVQKSADGKNNFATLGFVPGKGTTVSTHNYLYTDNAPPFTFYRLKQVDLDGSIQYSNTISLAVAGVAAMCTPRLTQNYPNPFNPSTQIAFSVTKEGPVSLRVYDILGREVATLINENRNPGEYTERFDGSRLASGVYMYVLQSADGRLTSRMILSK